MGLERTAAVLQGVISNYDTDLFVPLLKRAAELCGVDFQREEKLEEGKGGAASLRVIADHARATTFLIADGFFLRTKAVATFCGKLCVALSVMDDSSDMMAISVGMVDTVVDLMGDAYPELREKSNSRSRSCTS